MMRVLLEMWGYEVVEAEGEEETMQTAESFMPNVILVDTTRSFDEDIKIVSRLRVSNLPKFCRSLYFLDLHRRNITGLRWITVQQTCWPSRLDLDRLESYLETALPV